MNHIPSSRTSFYLLVAVLSCQFVAAQQPAFSIEVIDNSIEIGYGLAIGDVDGDGKPDILLADKTEIVWYRNPGNRNQKWVRHLMASNLTASDNVCIAARDLDGDGKVEVAVGAQWNPGETGDPEKSGAVFYLKRQADPTLPWKAIRLHHEVTIHRMAWGKTAEDTFQLLVLPLHGRNNVNGEGEGVKWIAFDYPKDVEKPWNYQLLDTEMHLAHNFYVMETEGKQLAAAVGGKEGVQVFTHTHNRWTPAGSWLVSGHPAGEVQLGQLSKTQRFTATIEPMHGTHLVVSTASQRTVLTDNLAQGHALATADLLGQGRDQVVVGWRNPNKNRQVGIRLYVGTDTEGTKWQEYALDESVRMACEDLKVADLDGDGKPDIIAAGRATLNVLVYWNNSK